MTLFLLLHNYIVNPCTIGKAGGVGDPHFITLDGKQYTFNGLGEYVLIDMQNGEFIIQIQTKQATNQDGIPIKATSMSIIAMKQRNRPTVQAQLDSIDGIAVLVENEFNNFGYNILDFEHAPSRLFDGGEVSVGSRFSRYFSFDNGVVIIVQAVNDILSFELSIPEVYYGNTQGLLGVWNDNQEDDFRRPDGTMISINSSDEAIFQQFGEKCKWWSKVDIDIWLTGIYIHTICVAHLHCPLILILCDFY